MQINNPQIIFIIKEISANKFRNKNINEQKVTHVGNITYKCFCKIFKCSSTMYHDIEFIGGNCESPRFISPRNFHARIHIAAYCKTRCITRYVNSRQVPRNTQGITVDRLT